MALAKTLLEQSSPEAVAAALVRLYRSKLPSPEELFDGGAYLREPREGFKDKRRDNADNRADNRADGPRQDWNRDKREARQDASDGVWFRLNIGREKNADPKWLIPLICRRGHVTKPDIGAIRIFGRETKFEIVQGAAERFAAAVRDGVDDGIRIEPAAAPPASDGPRPKFKPRMDRAEGEGRPPGKPGFRPRPEGKSRSNDGKPRPEGKSRPEGKPRKPKRPN